MGSTRQRGAFTIPELLVVTALTALLTSILCPAAQRAGRHARAIACQGQLHQWGLAFTMFAENDEKGIFRMTEEWEQFWLRYCDRQGRTLLLCPAATQYRLNENDPLWQYGAAMNCGLGSKFTAWKLASQNPGTTEPGPVLGSYGINSLALTFLDPRLTRLLGLHPSDAACAPLVVDCVAWRPQPHPTDEPPECDGALGMGGMKECCIDRHHGAINSLFLDGSVRKVGLKGLWTLRWSPWFDPHGPWTTAGGVQPEDWPRWMEPFQDD